LKIDKEMWDYAERDEKQTDFRVCLYLTQTDSVLRPKHEIFLKKKKNTIEVLINMQD